MKRVFVLFAAAAAVGALLTLQAGSPAAADRHPALVLLSRTPVKVRGTGFRPSETLRVSAGGKVVRVRTSVLGRFVATVPVFDRCTAGRVLALGAHGEQATVRIPPALCPPA